MSLCSRSGSRLNSLLPPLHPQLPTPPAAGVEALAVPCTPSWPGSLGTRPSEAPPRALCGNVVRSATTRSARERMGMEKRRGGRHPPGPTNKLPAHTRATGCCALIDIGSTNHVFPGIAHNSRTPNRVQEILRNYHLSATTHVLHGGLARTVLSELLGHETPTAQLTTVRLMQQRYPPLKKVQIYRPAQDDVSPNRPFDLVVAVLPLVSLLLSRLLW